MRKPFFSALCALFITVATQVPVLAASRIALLVGNQSYSGGVQPLKSPHADIAILGKALTSVGFQVVSHQDATRRQLLSAVKKLASDLAKAGPDAVGFFYYSGHGVARPEDKANYLIPIDLRDTSSSDFWFDAVKLDDVLSELESSAPLAAHFVVFDACRDELRLPYKSASKGFEPVAERRGMFIAFATALGAVALDESNPGEASGPYATALAQEVVRPGQDHLQLFQNVKEGVFASTSHKQVPWERNGLLRRIYFGGEVTTAKPTADPVPLLPNEVEQAWSQVKDSTRVAELEAFAKRYKDSFYADLAKIRMEEARRKQITAATPPPSNAPAIPSTTPAANILPQAHSPQPLRAGVVRIGVAGPLTGPNAAFGAQFKNGAEQAAADINAKDGINGQTVQLVFGDDASDPKQGMSVANKMAGDGVKFVIGHFNSGVTMPASDVYQENGIYMITPSATSPKITERGLWNVFRTCGRDDQQGQVAGKYILDNFKSKKVAIIHDGTTYGQGLADETKKTISASGMKEVLYEGINIGEKDFSALVSKIKASRADVVYWGGLHPEGGLIVRQMRDQGVRALFMGGDGITSDEFAWIGGPGVEGTLMTFGPDPRKNPAAAAVVKAFEARNVNPEAYTLYSYAALQVIAMSAADANSLDTKKVAAATKSGKPFKTVIGDLAYDKKGDTTRLDYVMYTWRKGADGKITYFQD